MLFRSICAFVTINQDKIVFADTETVINDSDKIKSKADKIAELNEKYLLNYIEDDNYIEEIDFDDYFTNENLSFISKNLLIPENSSIHISSSSNTIIKNILSEKLFTVNGTIADSLGTFQLNNYYDFAEKSKFQIAEWAYKAGVISQEEKIECYCDLIINKNFSNINCLENIINEIQVYFENNPEITFEEKINKVVDPRSNFLSEESTTVLTRAISNEGTYNSKNFVIHYDKSKTDYLEAYKVCNYFEEIREKYKNFGFKYPLIEYTQKYNVYLDPATNDTILGATIRDTPNLSKNTCSTYIYIYQFRTFNDDIKEIIAHEYFHAIEDAYNYGNSWLKEACANWGAISICDKYTTALMWVRDFILNSTDISLVDTSYGAVLFPLTIQYKYGGIDTIVAIFEELNKLNWLMSDNEVITAITKAILRVNNSGSFYDAYRSMATFLIKPNMWFNTVADTSNLHSWSGVKVRSVDVYSSQTTNVSDELDCLSSKYYLLNNPNSKATGSVKININFHSNDGSIQIYTIDKHGNHKISYPKTTPNGFNIEIPDFGTDILKLYVVVSLNYNNFNSGKIDVSISLVENSNSISFSNNTRYIEKFCYIPQGEYEEFAITFATSGTKTIQTFGMHDTVIELYNSSGTILKNDDDSGFGLNGLISYNFSANVNYKIRIKCYGDNFGKIKLSITPANVSSNYDNLDCIIERTGYSLNSKVQQNYTNLVKFVTATTCEYTFELESTFDNYIYVIDPRSNDVLNNNVDYNDDGGVGSNAKLTKELDPYVPYLIIYTQYNPSNALNSTNSSIKLSINQNNLPTVFYEPDYLTFKLVERTGFIVYNWKVQITNPNLYPVQVTYNSKMCFESDAKNYTNLSNLTTIYVSSGSTETVQINGNGTAGWITACIEYSINSSKYRRVTCGNGLSGNLTMNTPVNNQIKY